jgi:anti-anti-sigma regulatory factor
MKSALFIDSIAIGLVIGVMLKASGMNQRVRMLNVPDHVAKVFDTINLKKAFPDAY